MMLPLKAIMKDSPETVKRVIRSLLIPPLRTYFRYTPWTFGKGTLWKNTAAHLWWLESYVEAKTIFGDTMYVDAGDIVGKYIYYFGIWEPNLTNWIRGRLKPGDVFIDVGANIGYFSLLASRLVGERGKVVAIEALPKIFEILQANLETNSRNVRPVNMAVWDKEETLRIYSRPNNPTGTSTLIRGRAKKWQLEKQSEVPAAPLSAILTTEEIKTARLIKIDVEGAEWHVLLGMKSLLSGCRQDLEIMVEVSPGVLGSEGITCQDLLDFFRSWGFNPYRIQNDYSVTAYLNGRVSVRPERIECIPTVEEQTDLVCSRVDAASL